MVITKKILKFSIPSPPHETRGLWEQPNKLILGFRVCLLLPYTANITFYTSPELFLSDLARNQGVQDERQKQKLQEDNYMFDNTRTIAPRPDIVSREA